MIYVVQHLTPWVSSGSWRSLGAFGDPDEAKAFKASWMGDPDQVRIVEVPAAGSLKQLMETSA